MKTKLGKMYTQLNDNFYTELPKFFFKKFNVEIETRYNSLQKAIGELLERHAERELLNGN